MALGRRSWRWAIGIALAVLALLGGVTLYDGWRPVTARPALWRVSQGDRHAYLFGTIHAVPAGARWLSPRIEQAARESDVLVLEAAGLEAERNDRAIFEKLGRSGGLPPVAARLDASHRARLAKLIQASPTELQGLDRYESWAAALLIGAVANGAAGATAADAPEARLERLFRSDGRRVRGLETIQAQLGLFDSLPAPDQDALLAQAVDEASQPASLFNALYARWAAGDLRALEGEFLRPLASMPRLREALVERRNALWAQGIVRMLKEDDKSVPFIAVGAGHLIGPDSVEARLARLGWKVERLQ